MCLCALIASSRVKRKGFYRKSELQMFLLISGGHIGGQLIWRLHTKLYKGAWNVSANNSETVGHKDLRFGQIVYISVFYNIHFLGFFHSMVSNLFFLRRVQWKRRILVDSRALIKLWIDWNTIARRACHVPVHFSTFFVSTSCWLPAETAL